MGKVICIVSEKISHKDRLLAIYLSLFLCVGVILIPLADAYAEDAVTTIGTSATSFNAYAKVGTGLDFIAHKASVKNGWQKSGTAWRYYKSGKALKGWQKISGKWYFFNKSNGNMLTGWQKISGKWYLFNSSGKMLTGWQKSSGKWYYFHNSNGSMYTGWQKISGSWYHFKGSGQSSVGWLQSGSTWYYLDTSSYKMVTGSRTIGNTNYTFSSSGVLISTNKTYGEGTYKVGSTIPAGEYILLCNSKYSGYFARYTSSTYSDIIDNDNFGTFTYATVKNGEYFELNRAIAYPVSKVGKISNIISIKNSDGSYKEGTYKIGTDIPSGEYKLTCNSKYSGYFARYTSSANSDIIANDNFATFTYATVLPGEYFTVNRAAFKLA